MTRSANGRNGITRRGALKGMAATTALAAVPFRATAQETTLRWWSPQGAPAQLEAYNAQIASFQAANPGIKVVFETTSDEGYAAQLAAAFSSGEVPDIVTHLPSFSIHTYYSNGLVEPMNDVIDAVGADDFYDGANDVYKAADGNYVATGIGNVAANMLWLRTDLMEEAGIDKNPETWDELRSACQAMQKNGIYGAPLPYGRNSMTTRIFVGVSADSTPGFASSDKLGWFFNIAEVPGEPHFGMDITYNPNKPNEFTWNDLSWQNFSDELDFVKSTVVPGNTGKPGGQFAPPNETKTGVWGKSSADMASILFQRPVMVAVHATEMLDVEIPVMRAGIIEMSTLAKFVIPKLIP